MSGTAAAVKPASILVLSGSWSGREILAAVAQARRAPLKAWVKVSRRLAEDRIGVAGFAGTEEETV